MRIEHAFGGFGDLGGLGRAYSPPGLGLRESGPSAALRLGGGWGGERWLGWGKVGWGRGERPGGSACDCGLPDEEEVFVAGGGNVELSLGGGAAEGGADVFFGIREVDEGDFEGGAVGQIG